jgi:salicylate hydroxylase
VVRLIDQKRPLIVVGGGVGGLGAALALRQAGRDVVVYERAQSLLEVGAGLTLTPPGLRALEALGLLQPVLAASDDASVTAFIDHASGDTLRITPPRGPKASAIDHNRVMHRSDLHSMLVNAALAAGVQIHTGCNLVDLTQDGVSAKAKFADGRAATGSLVIGCDGLRSVARRSMFGADALRNIGLVAWRALVPRAVLDDLLGCHESAVHIGPGATFVRYTVRHGELVNCVGIVKTNVVAADTWSTPSTVTELAAQFHGWSQSLHAVIERIPEGGLYKWPLFDRDPIDRWTDRRLGLLGDAAHPMLPFLGIGASMALEDAVELARAVGEAKTPEQGLQLYEQARIGRASEVTLSSRRQADVMLSSASAETFRDGLPAPPSSVFDYDVRRGR